MTEQRFARGSEQSRRGFAGLRRWVPGAAEFTLWSGLALCVCGLAACSGTTDVVGVLPADELPADDETSELEGIEGVSGVTAAEGAPDGLSIVAGMRVVGWDERAALDWPFDVPLRDFFADGSQPRPFAPPLSMERQLMAVMGRQAKLEHVRVVAAGPEVTERLRDVFAAAAVELDGEMVARVMRDRRSDEYRVALGPASCGYSSSHHGGPCTRTTLDGLQHP